LEQFIDVAALRCVTDQVERKTTLETSKHAVKTQYGKVINQALIENGEDFRHIGDGHTPTGRATPDAKICTGNARA